MTSLKPVVPSVRKVIACLTEEGRTMAMARTEEDIIAELARLSAPLKVHREHERCCDICERGTAHYVGDDETQLLHVVDDWGNESWMHPRDYAKLRNM